jgi:hypothetical protein
LRAVRFAVGLAVATYVVMTVIVIVSASGSYMAQAEGLWTYLRHRPETLLIAAWPTLAMLGAGLMAHGLTGRIAHRALRAVVITGIVPSIAFPLTVIVVSRGFDTQVLTLGLLFFLLPCLLVTFIYTAMFLDWPPVPPQPSRRGET